MYSSISKDLSLDTGKSFSIKSQELITQMPDFTEPTVGNVMKVF